MTYIIKFSTAFNKEVSRLKNKYPSIAKDVLDLVYLLQENPDRGQSLGGGRFKIRLNIKSKRAGSAGCGRVITYVVKKLETVNLVAIYDKSDRATLSDDEIDKIISSL